MPLGRHNGREPWVGTREEGRIPEGRKRLVSYIWKYIANVAAVTKYIAGQEEHHKKHSFQEEYMAFLKKNHVEYDERYIWD